jgi:hypothetical protein
MRRSLRRQVAFLRLYTAFTSLLLLVLCLTAFRQTASAQRFGEVTVERINVVDANGTLRMVISNKDRMHPGVIEGVTIDRPRPVAGMIFFSEAGDELGGLVYSGQDQSDSRSAGVTFDQVRQDQVLGIRYLESKGQRTAGLEVWDRSDTGLGARINATNAANQIQDPLERKAVLAKAPVLPGPRRVFVGKNASRAATVSLSDAQG